MKRNIKLPSDNGNGKCLGSYVFYWNGFKQETTHTWFCMFDSTGLESPLPGLMHQMWTGKKPENSAPLVDSLNIGNFVRYQNIVLDKETRSECQSNSA